MPTKLTGNRRKDLATIKREYEAQNKTELGKWPNELTSDQREVLVRHLATLPLTTLRQGQSMTDEQIGMAYKQHNDTAMERLQSHREVLDDAIMRSEFDDLRHVKGARLKDYENRAFGVGPVISDVRRD